MSAQDHYQDTWVTVSPGVLELPTTKFRITYNHAKGWFALTWNGSGDQVFYILDTAKESAKRRMVELIEMGIEV